MSSSKAPTGPIGIDAYSRDRINDPLDELVRSGALALSQGQRPLTRDLDGLPIVLGFNSEAEVKKTPEQQSLDNVIQFLESPAAPQSVDWDRARKALCQLRDQSVSREGDAYITAWNIAMTAHNSTMQDLLHVESLLEELETKETDSKETNTNRLGRIETLVQRFPERACHLVGISTRDDLGDNAWDDGLAEMVLDKSIQVYQHIDQVWFAILGGQRRSSPVLPEKPKYYLRRFLDLDVIKALNKWRNYDVFLILERKAITAQRLRLREASA